MDKKDKTEKRTVHHHDPHEVEKRFPFLIWFIMILGLLLVVLGFYQFFRLTPLSTDRDTEFEKMPYERKKTERETVTVKLYYYNQEKDREIAEYMPGSPEAILPLEREIPYSDTLISDTIDLLLEGALTEDEKDAGFMTEFPGPNFRLVDTQLEDGTLLLIFEDPEFFTVGGSMRTGIMATQIMKTALQFPEVNEVRFENDELFQP